MLPDIIVYEGGAAPPEALEPESPPPPPPPPPHETISDSENSEKIIFCLVSIKKICF